MGKKARESLSSPRNSSPDCRGLPGLIGKHGCSAPGLPALAPFGQMLRDSNLGAQDSETRAQTIEANEKLNENNLNIFGSHGLLRKD